MDLKSFLKKYSTISNYFIDEFLDIYNPETQNNDFIISLDKIAIWLDSLKGRLKETLKMSYKKNIDYIIKKNNKISKGSGGHNREDIYLTSEAFKRLCMMSRTKKSEQVRQYFLEMENLVNKYKNHIIESMQQKINQLEHNQKPKVNSSKKIIYVFRALNTELTLYKIGKTINSKNRFNKHNSPMANDLEVLFQYEAEDINQLEACIKLLMKKAQYRKYKEIYQVDLDILKKTIKDCDTKITEINTEITKRNTKVKNRKVKQKGGDGLFEVDNNNKLFIWIPKD